MSLFLTKLKAQATGILLLLFVSAIAAGLFFHNKAAMDAKNQQITTLGVQVKESEQTITTLTKELESATKSVKTTEDTLKELKREQEDAKSDQVAAVAEIKRQMEAIDDKYTKLPKNAVNEERKAAEIAVVRSRGLWASYCLQEPTNVNCKK